MLQSAFRWLADLLAGSSLSEYMQVRFWIIPTLQIFHLLALAAVMVSVWVLCLRLTRLAHRSHSVADLAQRFSPWLWTGMVTMVISGSLLVIAEPLDTLARPMMQIKLMLLVIALTLTIIFQRGVKRDAFSNGGTMARSLSIKLLATAALLIWLSIAIAGRLIAYV